MSFAQTLESYIAELVSKRGKTVAETSHYELLANVLNAVGAQLKPAVKALTHPSNTGAGIPDLALFADKQGEPLPRHGVVEAKGISEVALIDHPESDDQVTKYVKHYGQVLVTNYYQFVLVMRGADGQPVKEETFKLAANEAEFWTAAQNLHALAKTHAGALQEYLLRVLRRNIPLVSAQEVAQLLASYAREAKARLETGQSDLSALAAIRKQLESALGLTFEDALGEEFFRSTLVQTLFYGVFAAWVLWNEHQPPPGAKFDLWNNTRRLNVPVIQELFSTFSSGSSLPLALEEVLLWTADALNRVDWQAFSAALGYTEDTPGKNAIQYFYEPFLEAFDPQLRRQLGVWYTPPEVVEYMVARVDAALRDELGIADGLADESVYVLDPCCGTGAYLVAVLRHIFRLLLEREGLTYAQQKLRDIAQSRVVGFELLPAPFVIAHLQLGILLTQYKVPFTTGQRAAVYLTNTLTGWSDQPRPELIFPELRKEREAADSVKRKAPILVVIGNPPYSGFAGTALTEERELSDAYRTTKRAPAPQGQGLNDLYIRFFRMAERRIVEQSGRGIVCFISNYSWLDGMSHTGMRERYLEVFDSITLDCLNGDRYKTGKLTPDGKPDPSIFSTELNHEGIQVGTAIALMVRKPDHHETQTVRFRHLWGVGKRDQLKAEALALSHPPTAETISPANVFPLRPEGEGAGDEGQYLRITPTLKLGLPFIPHASVKDYMNWFSVPEIFPTSFPGVITGRDSVFIDIDREPLLKRMQKYFDPSVNHEEMARLVPRVMQDANRFKAIPIREKLLKRGFLPNYLVRYCYRPFDMRWIYWEPETKLLVEKSPDYFPHVHPDNLWIEVRKGQGTDTFDRGYFSRVLSDSFGNGCSIFFPLYLYNVPNRQKPLFDPDTPGGRTPNLSAKASAYLAALNASDEKTLFYHTLAILHSPAYRVENAGALRQDWPRVPLPTNADLLRASAQLGEQIAALLDPETPVPGINQGDLRSDLKGIAELKGDPFDYAVTAHWGYAGQGGVVMPGQGKKTTRGDGGYDIYLNDTSYWAAIPEPVWDYTLGGYQVLKKWLSYREKSLLGRDLRLEEVREFTYIARRIAALLALQADLDANYRAVLAHTAH